jgi:hypothetical protein
MDTFSASIINKMSINTCFFVLLLTSTLFIYVNPQDALRQYLIIKDFFSTFKAGEFSIFDPNEKTMFYRIESDYSVTQDVKLVAYPSKQEVGRLKSKINFIFYKADISILDSQTNQWSNGNMEQNFKILHKSYDINWNGHQIKMDGEFTSNKLKFKDTNGELLAQFEIRLYTNLWKTKYDMKIFSNKYPEQIYLLALAGHDYVVSKNSKNNRG